MIGKSTLKILVGAVATAIAGTAMANTTLNTTTGDLFLNIENTANNTSYLFDTGVTQAQFNSDGNYSFNLSSDSALTGFLATDAGTNDANFMYSVVSATQAGNGPGATFNVYTTGNSNVAPLPASNYNNSQATAPIKQFLAAANLVTTTSSTSVVLGTGSDWGQGLTEGELSNNEFNVTLTPYGDESALNTAMAFYGQYGGTSPSSTTFDHTWDFTTSNDTLSYNPAPVPLPTPVLLLLSGLGLMGAVARRAKLAA
jgi:hypothetical protein